MEKQAVEMAENIQEMITSKATSDEENNVPKVLLFKQLDRKFQKFWHKVMMGKQQPVH